MSRDHGLALAFAVVSSHLNGRKNFSEAVPLKLTKNNMTEIKNERFA